MFKISWYCYVHVYVYVNVTLGLCAAVVRPFVCKKGSTAPTPPSRKMLSALHFHPLSTGWC